MISKDRKQYKANIHSHSNLSDGILTPEEMKRIYKEKGYSILAITDHNYPIPHNDMTEADFLMLTGYEANIKNADADRYTPEVHLCLYARDPENRTYIGYDPDAPRYIRYIKDPEAVTFVPTESPRVYTAAYINEFIESAKKHGYIVSHNHYSWSLESEAQVLDYKGCFSMEICNGGCWQVGYKEYNAQLYDKMLRMGTRIACHGTDDNHNAETGIGCDSFIAWTNILADELTYEAVFEALEKGDFYASRGPKIYEASMDGRHARIECSPAKAIFAYYGGKSAMSALAEDGEYLTEAEFDIPDGAKYVRFSVFDELCNSADTRGYFADELGWKE